MKLRGHHLICLLFLHEAYSEDFTKRLREYFERLKGGEEVEIISGIDELCSHCPKYLRGECDQSEIEDYDEEALSILEMEVGNKTNLNEITSILKKKGKELLEYCEGCEFEQVCKEEVLSFIKEK